MAFKLNRYEDQARLSVILALVGGLGALAAVGFVLRNLDATTMWVRYSPRSLYLPALGGALLVALVSATIGFLIGLNSAGQRRNQKSRLSWAGFFLNALVITIALSTLAVFFFARFPMELPA